MNAKLTVAQAARLANHDHKTIRRACQNGELRHNLTLRYPGSNGRQFRYVIRQNDLTDWLCRRGQRGQEENAERDDRIARLTRGGYTAPQIAAIVGVTERTVQRVRGRRGVAKPFCGNPLTADEIRRAADMLDDGASYGEVARTLGRNVATLRKHLRGRSIWRPGSGAEFRRYIEQLDAIVPPLNCGVAS